MFHEDHAPKRIINTSTTTFTIDDIPFLNVPQFDYNDASSPTPTSYVTTMTLGHFETGDRFQIDVEGVLSKNITFAGDSSANERSSSAFNIEKNLQEMPIFGDTGVSVSRTGTAQYTITISGESTKVFELFSGFATSDSGGTANEVIPKLPRFMLDDYGLVVQSLNYKVCLHLGLDHSLISLQKKVMMMKVYLLQYLLAN